MAVSGEPRRGPRWAEGYSIRAETTNGGRHAQRRQERSRRLGPVLDPQFVADCPYAAEAILFDEQGAVWHRAAGGE
jgi:hypothetical protein